MFFMMGITPGRKDFDFHQMIVCDACGAYGQYRVYMTYMVLSLFFIPVFKWNRKYHVETSCCHRIYELNDEVGRAIARGMDVEIKQEDLSPEHGYGYSVKVCRNCGFKTMEDFDFCPKCGERFYEL